MSANFTRFEEDKPVEEINLGDHALFFILAPLSADSLEKIKSQISNCLANKQRVYVFSQAFTVNLHTGITQVSNLGVGAFNQMGSDFQNAIVKLIKEFSPLGVMFINAPSQLSKAKEVVAAVLRKWKKLQEEVKSGNVSMLPEALIAINSWLIRSDPKVADMPFDELMGHCLQSGLGTANDPLFDPFLVWVAITFLRTGKWPVGIVAISATACVQTMGSTELPHVELGGKAPNCQVLSWDPEVKESEAIEKVIKLVIKEFCKELFDCLCGIPSVFKLLFGVFIFFQDIHDPDNIMAFLVAAAKIKAELFMIMSGTRPVSNRKMVQKVMEEVHAVQERQAAHAIANDQPLPARPSAAFALAATPDDLPTPMASEMTPQAIAHALKDQGVRTAEGNQPVPAVPATTQGSFDRLLGESEITFEDLCNGANDPVETLVESYDVWRWWKIVVSLNRWLKGQQVQIVRCEPNRSHALGCLMHTLVRMFPRAEVRINYPRKLRELMWWADGLPIIHFDGCDSCLVEGGSQCPKVGDVHPLVAAISQRLK
jgi:hypothetical protein